MYYREKIIDGMWHCKTSPNESWQPFNLQHYVNKIRTLEKEIKQLKEK